MDTGGFVVAEATEAKRQEGGEQPAPTARVREPLPQFDWLTEVAIPACVFGLLGSLLYYLIEVRTSLAGDYSVGPLRWVVFWFLLACIGIARIRTKYGGAAIAGYYSALLGGAIMLFIWVYTDRVGSFYGGASGGRGLTLLFNWALVGLVWWAASAVTREATLEENVETQLEGGLWSLLADEWRYPDAEADDRTPDEEVEQSSARPRHPGRLVLWVSLAALVLFAVGQRTIGGEGEHARLAFWCMCAYVLFALLLLALTNLSALRMQVRRRGISLAPAVTPAWIVASLIVTVLIVTLSALMPRSPTPEGQPYYVQLPDWVRDSERPELDEGPAQGMGREGERPGGDEQGAGSQSEEGEQAAGDEEGDQGAGGEEGPGSVSGGEEQGPGAGSGDGESERREVRPGDEGQPTQVDSETSNLARLLGWLLLVLAALVVLWFAWLHRRQLGEALRRAAKIPAYLTGMMARAWGRFAAWLSRLGWPSSRRAPAGNLPADPFVDIFRQGLDAGLPPAEVVRYVYRAFQVYAARSGHVRRDDQTALEFLRDLPPALLLPERAVERLTRAYVLATYSPREVTEAQVRGARETWQMMRDRLNAAGTGAGR